MSVAGVHSTCGPISAYSGRDCVKSLWSSCTRLYPQIGCRLSGAGYRVSSVVFGVENAAFLVACFVFRVPGFGFQVSDSGFRVSYSCFVFRVPGSGFCGSQLLMLVWGWSVETDLGDVVPGCVVIGS